MKKAFKLEEKCDNAPYCGAKRKCPVDAIEFDESKKFIIIDQDKCIGCGQCVISCPRSALELIEKE